MPLAVVVAVVGFQGPRFVAYMRYFAPAYPALCLFAAWGLTGLVRWRPGPQGAGSSPIAEEDEEWSTEPAAGIARPAT